MPRYIPRPTCCNSYAIGRFSPGGIRGYVAVHDDGTHGPLRATRDEAEADYVQAKAAPTMCPWLPHRTEDLPESVAYAACQNYYGF